MKSEEIRKRFLEFFEKRGHKVIPSASLIPENDPSALFTTAGMQPLVPYLLGEPHPSGARLVNIQKCVRTQDIDEVGDATHDTFFEMLGNWSLGDYFKEDAIKWSYELLTSKEEGFGLDPKKLYVTVFEGNKDVPADNESAEIWKKVGIPENRIYFMSESTNWWGVGDNGPCGPDTEMFYDLTEGLGDLTKEEYIKADKDQKVVEIWNNVFMEYLMKDGKVAGKLPKKNVDTGAGLERFAMVLQQKDNIFETDLFEPIINVLNSVSPSGDLRAKRIVADHIRSSVFMIADGVTPSNTDRGYILRRLIRRAVRFGKQLGLNDENYKQIIGVVSLKYGKNHSQILKNLRMVEDEFLAEVNKFNVTLEKGLKQFEKIAQSTDGAISGRDAFMLFTTYGFPLDLTVDLAKEKNITINFADFNKEFLNHQTLSRAGAEKKFKGGLADASNEKVIQYHTATHLLHQALHDVLGEYVGQKGSNITAERLRFDFTHNAKMTPEEIKKVEDIVNEKIRASLPVNKVIMSREEAEKTGARHFFGEKYGDQISIYYVGDSLETAYSKEFCGGPHVKNTSELIGTFKIMKEESVAAGTRRLKAILE